MADHNFYSLAADNEELAKSVVSIYQIQMNPQATSVLNAWDQSLGGYVRTPFGVYGPVISHHYAAGQWMLSAIDGQSVLVQDVVAIGRSKKTKSLGFFFGSQTARILKLDPATVGILSLLDATLPNPNPALGYMTGFEMNGKPYLTGGFYQSGTDRLASERLYKMNSEAVGGLVGVAISATAQPKILTTAQSIRGVGFVFGGTDSFTAGQPETTMPATNTITKVSPSETTTEVAFSLNGAAFGVGSGQLPDGNTTRNAYLFGGSRPGLGLSDKIEKFNADATAVKAIAAVLPFARWGVTGASTTTGIFLIGGSKVGFPFAFNQATTVDKMTNEDTIALALATLSSNRAWAGAAVVDNVAYIAGGTETTQAITLDKITSADVFSSVVHTLASDNMYKDAAGVAVQARL